MKSSLFPVMLNASEASFPPVGAFHSPCGADKILRRGLRMTRETEAQNDVTP
ncbi:MAG: hypothetical protein ACI4TW_08515 [Prevotella sp.]